MKYLLPGLFFLAVFGVYPVLYTAYASTTNYGTGLRADQGPGDRPDPEPVGRPRRRGDGATTSTPLRGRRRRVRRLRRSTTPRPSELFLGTDRADSSRSTATAELQVLTTTGRTFVGQRRRPTPASAPATSTRCPATRPTPSAYVMPGETEGAAITHLRRPGRSRAGTTRVYDADAGHDHRHRDRHRVPRATEGQFVADDGTRLQPGFTTGVGFANYREVLTGAEFRGAVPARARRGTSPSPSLSVVDDVRPRPAARHGVQRRADARPQALPLAGDHPLRPARRS